MRAIKGSRVKVRDCSNFYHGREGTVTDSTDVNSIVKLDNDSSSNEHLQFTNVQLEYLPANPAEPTKPAHDSVNHPNHYTFGKYEVKDVLLDWFPTNPLLWQVGKYIARAYHKGNALEDLKKARFYLDEEIQRLEKK